MRQIKFPKMDSTTFDSIRLSIQEIYKANREGIQKVARHKVLKVVYFILILLFMILAFILKSKFLIVFTLTFAIMATISVFGKNNPSSEETTAYQIFMICEELLKPEYTEIFDYLKEMKELQSKGAEFNIDGSSRKGNSKVAVIDAFIDKQLAKTFYFPCTDAEFILMAETDDNCLDFSYIDYKIPIEFHGPDEMTEEELQEKMKEYGNPIMSITIPCNDDDDDDDEDEDDEDDEN